MIYPIYSGGGRSNDLLSTSSRKMFLVGLIEIFKGDLDRAAEFALLDKATLNQMIEEITHDK